MSEIVFEIALAGLVTALGTIILFLIKGFEKKQSSTDNNLAALQASVSKLWTDHGKLAQQVFDNEKSLTNVNRDIGKLEEDNKAILVQINDNYQKLQVSIEDLKLRHAELTVQFKHADVTHSDIKGDIARIATFLYSKNKDTD